MSTLHSSTRAMQLKSDFIPLTVIQLTSINLEQIHQQLKDILKQAPQYFSDTPVVIDVSTLTNAADLNLSVLCKQLKQHRLLPIGIRGIPDSEKKHAESNGLKLLCHTPAKKHTTMHHRSSTKFVKQAIRSGRQLYAQNTDLIILGSVNPGAECMADGNIHIYGTLRGRALAGVNGNPETHIFCQRLEAELIAIAGYYLVKENISVTSPRAAMQHIYLESKQLTIEGI